VLVSSRAAAAGRVASAARLHPDTHYALVGASSKPVRTQNLAGLVFREDQAARLAGVVAGLVVAAAGDGTRAAWVGPEERPLATAALRGVRSEAPGALLLRQWTSKVPARCKEGALTAIGRGATVVISHGGLCAEAALNAAHEQGLVGLTLSDFELPSVAASWIAREAENGIYHGGDDVVFGLRSGALGVRTLDPAIPAETAVRARATVQELVSGLRP
jgi:basic membrane lipoprotein Med (substrate-binding protein (PBP1-ABC) superfamily)